MKRKLVISEDVLQRFWDVNRLGNLPLKTVSGHTIQIRKYGLWNRLQGPDFSGVQLQIDSLLFAGDVEFHWCTSDWEKHGHSADEKYNNVILHVVWTHDNEITTINGNTIPVLQLSDYFYEKDLQKMQQSVSSVLHPQIHEKILKCEGNSIIKDEVRWTSVVEEQFRNVVSNRIQSKILEVEQMSKNFRNDWETLAFVYIGKYWVDNQNRMAAERLLHSIPITFVKRSPLKELLAYAWILGGFERKGSELIVSEQFEDQMKFLRNKFQIESLDISWYFGKIRPHGWVQNRLIQYFVWLHGLDGQLSDVLVDRSWCSIERFMIDSPHFSYLGSRLGLNEQHASKVIANAIIPLQLAYSKHREIGSVDMKQYLSFLKELPPEDNRLVRSYSSYFRPVNSAFDSQAIIHQVNDFCRNGICSKCKIGVAICT